jgi:hypothetical protein
MLVSQGWAIKSINSCSDGLQIVIFSKGVQVRESLSNDEINVRNESHMTVCLDPQHLKSYINI